MIPKIIHYCWLSGDEFPPLFKKCIQSWKKNLPGWEFRLWDKTCLEEINEPWVHEAYEAKVYSHASDYIRLYAVYKFGGFYLDCDVEVLKDFSPLLGLDYVLSMENSISGYIESATFGAHAGNPYLKKCMNRYHNRHFKKDDGSYDYSYIIPDIMMQCVEKYTMIDKIEDFNPEQSTTQLFSPTFFGPKNYSTGKFDQFSDNTFSIHHFRGSWRPFKMRMNRYIWRHLGHGTAKFIQKTYQIIKQVCSVLHLKI